MGTARESVCVKLIASLFSGDLELLAQARAELSNAYGPVDWESDLLPFDHTDYYAREFGPGHIRCLYDRARFGLGYGNPIGSWLWHCYVGCICAGYRIQQMGSWSMTRG